MTLSPKIAIITCSHDAHVPYVTRHIETEHIVIDPWLVPSGTELSYAVDRDGVHISYDDVDLAQIKAVWYRKPEAYSLQDLPVQPQYQHYAYNALERHWHLLRNLFRDAFWISDYYQIKRAENKVWQLQLAHQIGFKTPATLMTSSDTAARKFTTENHPVVVKSLAPFAGHHHTAAPETEIFFSTRLDSADGEDFTGLNLAPAIFQQAIYPARDVRVNVVGDHVFAALIEGSAIDRSGGKVRDWKVAHYQGDLRIAELELPSDVAAMCVRHTKELGVQFGAIDLVRDDRDRYWFLENNPNGQWAFVEDFTRQQIGRAIAELLERT